MKTLYLEAHLRSLELQRLIYANKIKPDGVTAYQKQQDNSLRNPFTNKPFNFAKKDNVLYFGDDQSKNILVPLRTN